jgi:hypothetical protein
VAGGCCGCGGLGCLGFGSGTWARKGRLLYRFITYNLNTLWKIIGSQCAGFLAATVCTARYTVVCVFPPRHSARPFHHICSSTACLLPPRPPVTQALAALPPAVRTTSFALSPVPSSLLLSFSPAPSPSAALAQHSVPHYSGFHFDPESPNWALGDLMRLKIT